MCSNFHEARAWLRCSGHEPEEPGDLTRWVRRGSTPSEGIREEMVVFAVPGGLRSASALSFGLQVGAYGFQCTTKSKVVVQSTSLTPRLNPFMRAFPPRDSRDPLRVVEGGALPYESARHCSGFSPLGRDARGGGVGRAWWTPLRLCFEADHILKDSQSNGSLQMKFATIFLKKC